MMKQSTPLIAPCLTSSTPAFTRRSLTSFASCLSWRWFSPLKSGTLLSSSVTLGIPATLVASPAAAQEDQQDTRREGVHAQVPHQGLVHPVRRQGRRR